MQSISFDELKETTAPAGQVFISVINYDGDGITIGVPYVMLEQLTQTPVKPSYDALKAELFRRFKTYKKKPNSKRGEMLGLLSFSAMCAISPETPDALSAAIRERGSARITTMLDPKKKTLVACINDRGMGVSVMSDMLKAAPQDRRFRYIAGDQI